MSRTVATIARATHKQYFHYEFEYEDDFKELISTLREMLPSSYYPTDYWLEREVLVFAENKHHYVTISEYMGLCALCVVPKTEYEGLASKSLNNTIKALEPFNMLRLIGRFSNGEAIYEEKKKPEA